MTDKKKRSMNTLRRIKTERKKDRKTARKKEKRKDRNVKLLTYI